MCETRAWDELVDLKARCEHALERGKQLWPIAAHVDYRLALEAPGEYAGAVLESRAMRFAPGPLTEVTASTHRWSELVPHMPSPQAAAYVAQERVLRGEVLTGDGRARPEVLELPLELQPWEPTYALATYRANEVEVAEPWEPKARLRELGPGQGRELDDPDVENALLDLVQPWVSESNGAARAAVVEGDAAATASRLTFGSLRMGELTPAEALQRMAWAAASGGAHGRRRGAALGRFLAWYATSVLAGLGWPVEPEALGDAVAGLNWFRWDEGAPEEGWVLRFAVESREGWSAALAATDLLDN
ncbi:MAG: hypothetical protein ACRDJJ_00885 [Actinomycetota bacterium]